MTAHLTADVCVIGAGAGGAVVAAELAEGGADVILLEQGPRHDPGAFTAHPPEMLARLYRDGGQTVTLGAPPILLPLGRGIGGTTLVNSGTCFRTPPRVLARWERELGLETMTPAQLEPAFARVEEALSIAPVTPALAGRNAEVARRGAAALGWSHGWLRRNARGCVGSGVCAFGCPSGAKQDVGSVYVPRAQAAGARVLTGADVRRIVARAGRVRGVEVRISGAPGADSGAADADRGATGALRGLPARAREVFVAADTVVLAAGTIHTPGLLRRSRLAGRSGQLGRNLSLHPATAAFALMDEEVNMAHGVPQSLYVDEFADEGIVFEGVAGPPAYAAASLPLTGRRHAEAMADYKRLAQFGLMVSDSSRGRVHVVAGRPVVRYDLVAADVAKVRAGLARLEQLFLAAGAREVYLPLPPGTRPHQAKARDLKLMAFHPLGTARAHRDPAQGVVDQDLRHHEVEGLHVADGSVVPSALGVNPQLTIMALATRLAYALLDRPIPTEETATACRS
ncbi:GMC family oxidoreductase [Conexibacter sp. JD483]|uniref:GMC family oxidoreductase n=1 Tax=unclassified Conexibacter TaxID=2627773 RepID=UPI002726367D|nr:MULTISPECIES: GMC family oxidoreductase [unclassified Conexibacter]MDO8188790.1 GMC family oxidoreductase [Conexibacter sp. CPCC 205706]MDO8201635.1 GMC family oxidoreductase [Conexibacter sp. CPCC 205762]MDR9371319.1 GMC family oxidoreductase [Conexibacter sp. JD483]